MIEKVPPIPNHPYTVDIRTSADVTLNSPDSARLVVVEMIYYQQHGQQPTSIDNRYARWIKSSEQVYTRRFDVGFEDQPLDSGWFSGGNTPIGLMILENQGVRQVEGNPTDEEKAEAAASIIEVCCSGSASRKIVCGIPMFIINPGESLRVQPINLSSLSLRCPTGKGRCLITIFPG